jgi:hypothetical protein
MAVAVAERRRIVIPYKPRNWARPMHASFLRWFAIVMHRRGGKTTSWLNHHQRAATDDAWESQRLRSLEPNFTPAEITELLRERIYAHVLPTLVQARTVAWDKLKFIAADVPGADTNERDMSITYACGKGSHRVVRLFGADNIDALRGFPLSGLSLDEFSQHPPGVFGEVLSKSLADHLGYCAFLGTIKGKNQLFKTHEAAKGDPEWFTLWQDVNASLATEEGATITAIRRAMEDDKALIDKGLMTQAEYDQEWFLSTEAAIKGAYYAKELAAARRDKRIGRVPHDPALLVHDVWDIGKGPKMAVGMYQRFGKSVQKIDYLEGSGSDGIEQMIQRLQERGRERGYTWGKHFAPHDIKSTDLGTGKTRLETAGKLGWHFTEVRSIPVDDGISAGRLMFARLWIDETHCAPFIESIGQYRQEWDDKRGMFKEIPLHDWTSHGADEYRYAAVAEELMTNDTPKPKAPQSRPIRPSGLV